MKIDGEIFLHSAARAQNEIFFSTTDFELVGVYQQRVVATERAFPFTREAFASVGVGGEGKRAE